MVELCINDDLKTIGLSSENGHDKVNWGIRINKASAKSMFNCLFGKWPLKWFVHDRKCDQLPYQ